MLRFTQRQLQSTARHLAQPRAKQPLAHPAHARTPATLGAHRPGAHAAGCSQHARLLHSAAARLSEAEPLSEAQRVAAHREEMRKTKEKARKASQEAAAAPSVDAAKTAPAGEATSTPSADPSAKSSAPPSSSQPSQGAVNQLWTLLRREVQYLDQHLSAKQGAAPRAKKLRPKIQKSTIPLKAWSEDPKEMAEEQARKDAEKAEGKEGESASVPVEAEYTGPTALQAVDNETHWDKRFERAKELVRRFGVAVPKKALRAAVSKSDTASELSAKLLDKYEEAKEQWETSQDPKVWRMRDMVEKVVGESDTGMALGEIMKGDPNWNYFDFLKEMEEVMIPEVVQAFRLGDMKLLKLVTEGDAARTMFASFRQREEKKVEWDPLILDIRGVDIVKASLVDDTPYIHLTFVCQHVAVERDAKTGEVKDPTMASTVQNTYYSWAIRRDYESKYYDWKIFEFQYQHIIGLGI